jgi:hypothetical protein
MARFEIKRRRISRIDGGGIDPASVRCEKTPKGSTRMAALRRFDPKGHEPASQQVAIAAFPGLPK